MPGLLVRHCSRKAPGGTKSLKMTLAQPFTLRVKEEPQKGHGLVAHTSDPIP